MNKSEVTVLIPFYNPGAYIREALASVFAQTYQDWQLILIDDASTDHTAEMIVDYLKDPRVKMVSHLVNQGQSKSLNTGLKLVETPFVIQLDADDWFFPYTLEVLMKETLTVPDTTAVISGNINLVFEDTIVDAHLIRSFNKQILKRQEKRQRHRGVPGKTKVKKGRSFQDRYDFLLANRSVWPRFYRTSALKSIGGWPVDDPYEGRYAEDIRVLFRLIEEYHFHWVDELLLNHRRHSKNQTNQMEIYRKITEWTVRDALLRWGDEYEPIFNTVEDGWIAVSELKRKKTNRLRRGY
ncbi:glycosyltransferase family 2 protein [Bacillus sp. ISL-46]|uniref:glycosyltransferase family 2 protein n=1 Tax=Bacillus sp. ISL-46 TaxID=2819129 RepID=UPI001BE5FF30|nr:glycosyltransferase family 2 protein [Bacillus sp. ISL-46]MBT2719668.1 glycosyltransferase family 2 protein [Bacillus sp. ISL-46]